MEVLLPVLSVILQEDSTFLEANVVIPMLILSLMPMMDARLVVPSLMDVLAVLSIMELLNVKHVIQATDSSFLEQIVVTPIMMHILLSMEDVKVVLLLLMDVHNV